MLAGGVSRSVLPASSSSNELSSSHQSPVKSRGQLFYYGKSSEKRILCISAMFILLGLHSLPQVYSIGKPTGGVSIRRRRLSKKILMGSLRGGQLYTPKLFNDSRLDLKAVQVREALEMLYSRVSNSETRTRADKWLSSWQLTDEAWQVSDYILSQRDSPYRKEVLFFAAKTLHDKVCNDLQRIPLEMRDGLRSALLQNLVQLSSFEESNRHKGSVPHLTFEPHIQKLMSAVVAIAIHTNWVKLVPEILDSMQGNSIDNNGGVHLPKPVGLALLTIIPEEVKSPPPGLEASSFHHIQNFGDDGIHENSKDVIKYLEKESAMANHREDHGSEKTLLEFYIFRCFATWLPWATSGGVELNAKELSTHPVLRLAPTAIGKFVDGMESAPTLKNQMLKQCAEAAADAIESVLENYPSGDDRPTLEVILYGVAAQRNRLDELARMEKRLAPQSEHSEHASGLLQNVRSAAREMVRVMSKLCDAMIETLIDPSQHDFEEGKHLVGDIALACTSYPEPHIASLGLIFWRTLASCLLYLPSSRRIPDDIKVFKEQMLQSMLPGFENAVRDSIHMLKIPEDVQPGISGDEREVKIFRYEVVEDGLRESGLKVFGPHILIKILLREIERNPDDWRTMEAVLFSLRTLWRHIIPSPKDSFPQSPEIDLLIGNLLSNVINTKHNDRPQFRSSALLLAGSAARYLQVRPQLLVVILEWVVASIGVAWASKASPTQHCLAMEKFSFTPSAHFPAASVAFRQLCEECRSTLLDVGVLDLVPFLHRLRRISADEHLNDSHKPKLRDELEILEGLMLVAIEKGRMDNSGVQCLFHIVDPILESLQISAIAVESVPDNFKSGNQKGLLKKIREDLNRLNVVFESLAPARGKHASQKGPEPLLDAWPMILKSWPILGSQGILRGIAADPELAEDWCSVVKHAVRNAQSKFTVLLLPVLQFLSEAYRCSRFSSWLYLLSILVVELKLSSSPELQKPLFETVTAIAETFFTALPSLEAMNDSPDNVEDFYRLLIRCISHAPEPLLAHRELLDTSLRASTVAVRSNERNAQRTVFVFWAELLELGLDIYKQRKNAWKHGAEGSTKHQEALSQSLLAMVSQEINVPNPMLWSIGATMATACVESLGGLFYSPTPLYNEGGKGSASYVLWSLLMLEELGKSFQERNSLPAKLWIQNALCKIPRVGLDEKGLNPRMNSFGMASSSLEERLTELSPHQNAKDFGRRWQSFAREYRRLQRQHKRAFMAKTAPSSLNGIENAHERNQTGTDTIAQASCFV